MALRIRCIWILYLLTWWRTGSYAGPREGSLRASIMEPARPAGSTATLEKSLLVEREWSGRLAKRRLKAGGCASMQLHWLRYCCTHCWLAARVVSMLLLH
jgi:hypothetical protein